MDPLFLLFLAAAGAMVGFLSGLLGIGGGIVMFPVLLYGPPLLGLPAIDVKSITGMTMVQGFFAALTAVYAYQKNALVSRSLVVTLGSALFFSSLAGALLSSRFSDESLLLVFGILAFLAAIAMFIPRSYALDETREDAVVFNRSAAVGIGILLGFSIGLVGQGGAFILIPVMLYLLKIPLRVALGSTLGIGLFSSSAGLLGKAATGQIPYLLTLPLLAGAVPLAWAGSIVGRRTKSRHLKWLLAALIAATAINIWSDIL